jgi:tetratricopeptide (TPR) repeat protein
MRRAAWSISLVIVASCALGTPAAADEREICRRQIGDATLDACDRIINSRQYPTRDVADAYINRGQQYYTLRNYNRAAADFTSAIALDPYHPIAYGNRGNVKHVLGQLDAAIADYSRAIELDRGYTSAYTGRGIMYERQGRIDLAIADFRTALSLPQKYQDGRWGHDTARQRLQALGAF